MADEKIDPITGQPITPPATDPPATPPAPPEPPEDDEPKEPGMGDSLPNIKIEDKDEDGNELSDEEKSARYSRAAADAALDNSVKIRVGNEVNNYLASHPEYAIYADKIRTWVNHPNRFGLIKSGLPVENVIIEAIGVKNIMRIGAEVAAKSKEKAKESQDGANGKGTTPPAAAADLKKMPISDFNKIRDTIRGNFIKRS